jgi:hypothetical protein
MLHECRAEVPLDSDGRLATIGESVVRVPWPPRPDRPLDPFTPGPRCHGVAWLQ